MTTGRRNNVAPTSRKFAPKIARGFTLLELIFVMLIVSVIAGLAVPSLRGFLLGRKSADAAAQVIAVCQYARTQAVGSGNVYRLQLDPVTRSYWLTAQHGAEHRELGNEFGRRFLLPDNTTAGWQDASHAFIDFFPDGRVEASTLVLTDADGKQTAIGCLSETEPLSVLDEAALIASPQTSAQRGMR